MRSFTWRFLEPFCSDAGNSECNESRTTLLLAIDIEVAVSLSYGCSAFKGGPGLTVCFLLEFKIRTFKEGGKVALEKKHFILAKSTRVNHYGFRGLE